MKKSQATPPQLALLFAPRHGASYWQVGASLLWLPQAALLAWAVQRMAQGQGWDGTLWTNAAALLALGALRAWCEGKGVRQTYRCARAQVSELRAQVVAALAQGSPLDRQRPASGLAASAVAEQAEAIVPWLSRYQPAMWRVRWVPAVIALAVASQSWVAALILLFAAPLIPLFMAVVGWQARAASQAQMVELGSMNAFLLDRLRGLASLRALGAVDRTAERLRASAESLRERTMRVLKIAFLSSAVLELFSALAVAMVAVYIGFHLLGQLNFGAWNDRLSLGQALFILLLAPAFFEPLRDLSAVWHDRAAGQAALDQLAVLAQQRMPMPGQAAAATAHGGQACAVSLRGLQACLPGESAILAPVDLELAAGEQVALWSPSGSGKSILLAQMAGLLPIGGGEVWIDGLPMVPEQADRLRARMAWMGQQPHMFSGSVGRNISLGREGLPEAALTQAMQTAALADVAQARLACTLGEGGTGLSGGELVRLALARLALRADAGLLLVDEPTAHLDPQTAAQVIDALLQLAKGRTLIVATHDPLLAARLQRVVRLPMADELPRPQQEVAV